MSGGSVAGLLTGVVGGALEHLSLAGGERRRFLGVATLVALALVASPPAWAQGQQDDVALPPEWQELGPPEATQFDTPALFDSAYGVDSEAEGDAEAVSEDETSPTKTQRIVFAVPFPEDQGGGTAQGSADRLEYLGADLVVASGGVELRYQGYKFQGERVSVDLEERSISAVGDIIVDQGPRRLTGSTLEWDLRTNTGVLTDAKAFVDPDIFFTGAEIAKVEEDVYSVVKGKVTSCIQPVPAWSFSTSRARVEVEGFARMHNTVMRAKKVPFLYTPYLLWPAKTKRTSGLLLPHFGYSSNRGYVLGMAWFQTLGRSVDTTFYADWYTEDYYAFGNEFRYHPWENTQGILESYMIQDPVEDDWRWKVRWKHVSEDLPGGLRGVVNYADYSDFGFFRDFERDFNQLTIRRVSSYGFLSGSWGLHSATLLVEQQDTFVRRDVTDRREQLPELEYRLRSMQLGRLPLYLSGQSAFHYVRVGRENTFQIDYQRFDFYPQLTVPLRAFPWLSLSATGGARATWYSDSDDPEEDLLGGGSLTRLFPTADAEIVGPSISRVFGKGIGSFEKFKHVVEPRFGYSYVGEFEDQDHVPIFDEVDFLRSRHLYSYSLINRLLGKPRNEELDGGAREIMAFRLTQVVSLDPEQPLQSSRDGLMTSQQGPVAGQLRFFPGMWLDIQSDASYNTLFSRLESFSLTGGVGFVGQRVGLTWFRRWDPERALRNSDQLRVYGGFEIVPGRLRLDAQVNYNLLREVLQQQRYILQYTSQCWGLIIDFREIQSGRQRDQDIRFAFSLKNVGTFIDLTGRTTSNL